MLELTIPGTELFNEKTGSFTSVEGKTIILEHSLLSVSKWEARWHRPFLNNNGLSLEETIDYLMCMTITKDVDPLLYTALTMDNINQVNHYIEDSMTATTIRESEGKGASRRIITSELIYAWMFALRIPKECEKWHLNRLMMLIRVMDIEQQPKKKMRKGDIMRQNAALNAARKKKMNTRG